MKKSTAALAVILAFSSLAEAGPRKPPAPRPAAASQPSSAPNQTQRKLFSKWHGGSCEIIDGKFILTLGKKKKEIKLPDLRAENEAPSHPVQLICRKDGVKIIYQRRIDIFESYDELMKGANAVVTVPFKEKIIESAFFKDGREAVVVFENGQVQHLDLMDGNEFSRWTSKKPNEDARFERANIGESGGFVHAILPNGKYVLIYTNCNGRNVAYEDKVKNGAAIRCLDNFCLIRDGKGRAIEKINIPCPPKKEKK